MSFPQIPALLLALSGLVVRGMGSSSDALSLCERVVQSEMNAPHAARYSVPENGLNDAPARKGRREVESEYLPVFAAGVAAGAQGVMPVSHASTSDLIVGLDDTV